jgi:putative peptidoglycan lipid II flippase
MAALAPAVSSAIILLGILAAPEKNGIYIVGLATAVGFVLQFLVLIPSLLATGIRFRPKLTLRHPAIPALIRTALPLVLYLVVSNGALFVERSLASRISAGAVTTLNYALRLFLVPANFLVSPLATVAYPGFAREALRDDHGQLRVQVAGVLRMVVFLFLPITVWLVINAKPITALLYQHGKFTAGDSQITAAVLANYALGILPYGLSVIVLRCLYALRNTTVPLWVESGALVFYTGCAVALSRQFGIQGLALARSAEFMLVSAALLVALKRRLGVRPANIETFSFILRSTCASLVMGAVLWTSLHAFPSASGSSLQRTALVLAQVALGAGVYMAAALLLQLQEAKRTLAIVQHWSTASRIFRA